MSALFLFMAIGFVVALGLAGYGALRDYLSVIHDYGHRPYLPVACVLFALLCVALTLWFCLAN